MNKEELFAKAQNVAARKSKELNCSCLIQSGSSLLKEDFTLGSDIDLLAIFEDEVDEKWDYDFREKPEVSVMKESKEEFVERLEEGSPFELMALEFGKVRKDDGFLKDIDESQYGSTKKTSEIWIRSGLNQYCIMLGDVNLSMDFCNAAYHSFRSFSRVLILEEMNELLERDKNIKGSLATIDKKASRYFWSLREGRFDPPEFDYIELKDIQEDERYQAINKVEYIGKRVLQRKNMNFPSFSNLNELLKERGYRIFGGPIVHGEGAGEKIHISGISDEEHEIFEFDLESGNLESLS